MQHFKHMQPLLLALLFVSVTGGLLGWLWMSVKSSGDELVNRMQTIENQRVFDNQLNQLLAVVDESREQREVLHSFILKDENDTIRFLSELDEIALEQDVQLATQELKVVEEGGAFNKLAVRFVIDGNEDAVLKMIRMFETMPYHGEITALTFGRTVGTEGERNALTSISLLLTISNYDQ